MGSQWNLCHKSIDMLLCKKMGLTHNVAQRMQAWQNLGKLGLERHCDIYGFVLHSTTKINLNASERPEPTKTGVRSKNPQKPFDLHNGGLQVTTWSMTGPFPTCRNPSMPRQNFTANSNADFVDHESVELGCPHFEWGCKMLQVPSAICFL